MSVNSGKCLRICSALSLKADCLLSASCLPTSVSSSLCPFVLNVHLLLFTGLICPDSELCRANCNLHGSLHGGIHVAGLEAFACDQFRLMNVAETRNKYLPAIPALPPFYRAKIALVGAGPASISCATYLARLGFQDISIFEKGDYVGGLSVSEIPRFRLGVHALQFERSLLEGLGVKILTGSELGGKEYPNVAALLANHDVVFLGIGKPAPIVEQCFKGLTDVHGFYTSKSFLPRVAAASKQGFMEPTVSLPTVSGRVLVLGGGDAALDCARSALRCGATRVTVCMRRSTADFRATRCVVHALLLSGRMDHVGIAIWMLLSLGCFVLTCNLLFTFCASFQPCPSLYPSELFQSSLVPFPSSGFVHSHTHTNFSQPYMLRSDVISAYDEQIDFLAYVAPSGVKRDSKSGRIIAVEFAKTEKKDAQTGTFGPDNGQKVVVQCDCVISAFGCTAEPEANKVCRRDKLCGKEGRK